MSVLVRQGVVLAAGRGTRLQPLSGIYPKPLQPVCNKPIMQYHLEAMRAAGIQDVAVIVGATAESIRAYFDDGHWLGLRIHYIVDPAPAGIAASLACAESWVDGPFAVFLGDIFLAIDDLSPAFSYMGQGASGTIVCRRDTPEAIRRNFAVITDHEARALRVLEKPPEPPTDLKGCGVYVFDTTIFDAIRKTPRSPLRNEYEITDALQILIDLGRPVYVVDIVRWDMNITFPEDLLACNLRLLREQGVDRLIGEGAFVNPETLLISTIVGARATIDAAVRLEECVVLPGTHVTHTASPFRQQILGNGFVWTAGG